MSRSLTMSLCGLVYTKGDELGRRYNSTLERNEGT